MFDAGYADVQRVVYEKEFFLFIFTFFSVSCACNIMYDTYFPEDFE